MALWVPPLRTFDARPALFNADPAFLMKWAKAATNVRAGLANARVACVGASLSRGAYGDNSTVISLYTKARPYRLAAALSALGLVSSADNFMSGHGLGLTNNTTFENSRISFGAGWTVLTGLVGGELFWNGASATTKLAFTPATAGYDRADVIYATNPGNGTATVDWNGANSSIINNNQAQLVRSLTSVGTAGAYPINITPAAASSTIIGGIIPYLAATKQVSIFNVGWDGSKTGDWSAIPATLQINKYSPDLTILDIDMCLNDFQAGGITLATMQNNLQSLITSALTTGDVLLVLPSPITTSRVTAANQASIASLGYTLGALNKLPVANFQTMFKDFTTLNAVGFSGDGDSHPNVNGYDREAAFLASVLAAA